MCILVKQLFFFILVLTVHIVCSRPALSLIGLFVSPPPSMSHVCLEYDFAMLFVPIILEENYGDGDDNVNDGDGHRHNLCLGKWQRIQTTQLWAAEQSTRMLNIA